MSLRRSTRRWRRALVVCVAAALLPVELSVSPAGADVATFELVGGGWGHGVGLSQYGAKGRAEAGHGAHQILAAYFPGAAVTTRAPSGIRVKVGDVAATAITQATATMVVSPDGVTPVAAASPGQPIVLSRSGGSVVAQIGGATVVLGAIGYVGFVQGNPITIGATGRRYRWGRLVVRPNAAGGLELVIDELSLEQWTYGIAEIPASWPAAALEAQAVAARTFGAHRQAAPRHPHYDVDHLAGDGVYRGFDHESSVQAHRWIAAVDATAGQVLTRGGAPITAFYGSSNGGHTEASAYVFVTDLPYLVATPDPFDAAGNPYHSWSRTYGGPELGAWLRAAGRPDIGDVVGLDVVGGTGASGRLDKATIRVRGQRGTDTVTGNQLRAAINASAPAGRTVLSTKFSIRGGRAPATPPIGSVELVFPWGGSHVAVVGWAADLDALDERMLIMVAVNGSLAGAVWTDGRRDDVRRLLPMLGDGIGFGGVVRAPAARSRVCLYAVNASELSASMIGCRDVVRPTPKRRTARRR